MRIIALIDQAEIIERILKHLSVWDPPPEPSSSTGPDLPLPKGETPPLTYHPLPDIDWHAIRKQNGCKTHTGRAIFVAVLRILSG